MRKLIAIILFTLFNLGVFGVSIERHLCCHSQQDESTMNHCNDDESCCDDNEDCCDEIVSQVKIAKDFTSQDFKIDIEHTAYIPTEDIKYNATAGAALLDNNKSYPNLGYFPPPKNFQVVHSLFLI